MAIIKCKMCGGDIELSPDKTFGTCEYCGSTMTFPKVDDEHRAAAFNRGNHFRRIGEFDKALAVYERIVQEDNTDAEAHWCCALCRFGIEYVEDPASYEWLPTCHRASFDSFLEDVDYLAAVEYSDGITRRQYQKDAAKIAEVQRGILAASQNEEPFDVFICYKESDDAGIRTVDSTLAQDIYYQLVEQGRRVFFARITLEDKAGTEYEPYIFAALNSAKVMIAVGTKPEHFNAVWVKNEWSRFLALMKKDRSKLLIPCYRDMDPYDLPEQLSVLQSYDMSKIGFIQDLIRGVSKVLDAGKKPEIKGTIVMQSEGGGNLTALLKRGEIALEDNEWNTANDFFEQALNINAECSEAYFGKVLAARRCSTAKQLILQEKNVGTPASGKRLTACPADEDYITQAVKDLQIPLFLTEETIRARFGKFDRSYESVEDARQKEFQQKKQALDTDKLFSKVVRYAKDGQPAQVQKEILDAYQARIVEGQKQDAEQKAHLTQKYTEFLDETRRETARIYADTLERLSSAYASAVEEQESAARASKKAGLEDKRIAAELFQATAEKFRALGPHKDSPERTEVCAKETGRLKQEIREKETQLKEQAAREAEEERRRQAEQKRQREEERQRQARRKRWIKKICTAMTFIVIAALAAAAYMAFKNHQRDQYAQAEALLAAGNYDEAAAAFEELGGYSDAKEQVLDAKYQKAKALMAAGNYEEAAAAFEELSAYSDAEERILEAKYQKADALLKAGDKPAAAMAFAALDAYQDAHARSFAIWDEIAVRETISSGSRYAVGLKSDGTVVAVGKNSDGQCNVESWADIVAVSTSAFHTVGLKADGTVVAVGENEYGQCDVESWTNIVAVSAGNTDTVGLKSDGTVVVAGYNQNKVDGWTDIVAVSADSNIMGLKSNGAVVGTGNQDAKKWTDIVAISTHSLHTVGLKSDGTVVTAGNSYYGELSVDEWENIVAVSTGSGHTVGLKSDGSLVVAGGYGAHDVVESWTNIVAVSAGTTGTVGLKSDGTVVVEGNGQLNVSGWTDIKLPNK